MMKKLTILTLAIIMLLTVFPLVISATSVQGENGYEGKTIACIGDSITAAVGVTKDENDYVTLLAEQLGMDYIRLGVSGTTLCTDGHRTCNIGKQGIGKILLNEECNNCTCNGCASVEMLYKNFG